MCVRVIVAAQWRVVPRRSEDVDVDRCADDVLSTSLSFRWSSTCLATQYRVVVVVVVMAKVFDFQWQIPVPDFLLEGTCFDRWEEVRSPLA